MARKSTRKNQGTKDQNKVFAIVTEDVTKALQRLIDTGETVNWIRPAGRGSRDILQDWHMNGTSGRRYGFVNNFLLDVAADERGFSSRLWFTKTAVMERGGTLKAGAESVRVYYWSVRKKKVTVEEKDANGNTVEKEKEKRYFLYRYHRVFNWEDTEGVSTCYTEREESGEPIVEPEPEFTPIEKAEQIWDGMQAVLPKVRFFNAPRAYYAPGKDYIGLPERKLFKTSEGFYGTAFHEAVHSTGHEDRLNRKKVTNSDGFGNHDYSVEELVAEMGSAFLCEMAGIRNERQQKQNVAYIQSWIKALKNDVKMLAMAAGQAEKAVKFLTSFEIKNKGEEDTEGATKIDWEARRKEKASKRKTKAKGSRKRTRKRTRSKAA